MHLINKDLPSIEYRSYLSILKITVSEFLCYRLPWIRFGCHDTNHYLSRVCLIINMTYQRMFSTTDKMSVASVSGTAYLRSGVRIYGRYFVAQSCVVCMDLSFIRLIWPLYYLTFDIRILMSPSIPLRFVHVNNKISITSTTARGQQSGNQECTIQRNWQHCAYTKQDENKQYKRKTQHRKLNEWTTRNSLKNGRKPMCSRRVADITSCKTHQ